MSYKIYTSRQSEVSKSSKELRMFSIDHEEEGLAEAAMQELWRQGYDINDVHGPDGWLSSDQESPIQYR